MGITENDPDRVVLAIDGGNSKTDVAVLSPAGAVLAQLRGPGASRHALGLDGAVMALESLAIAALGSAGRSLGPSVVSHAGAYLAGADLAREEAELLAAIEARGWSKTVTVDNDTFALLRAGSPLGYGVAVVCGAGINCVAVAPDGRVVRFPSLGLISGDWGGGLHLGREVMSAAARDEDGRGPRTMLRQRVLQTFAAGTVLEVIEALHFAELPTSRLHELTPVLFDVAAQGDSVATALVERLATEVAAFVIAAVDRLDWSEQPVPVVLGGAVLAAGQPGLDGGVRRRITAAVPRAQFVVVTDPPILGAALLALDADIGAATTAEVESVVRHQFGRPVGLGSSEGSWS